MLQRELVSWSLKMKLHSARKKFHNACNLWRVSNWCQNNINCKDFVMLTSSFCEGTRGVSHPKLNRKIIYGDKGKLWDKWGTWRSAPFNSRTEHPIPTGYETDGPWASWNAEGGGGRPSLRLKSNPARPAHSLFAAVTELSWALPSRKGFPEFAVFMRTVDQKMRKDIRSQFLDNRQDQEFRTVPSTLPKEP